METVKNLEISLKSKKYKIFLGSNLLNQIDFILKNHLTNKNIVILYDKALKDRLNILELSLSKVTSKIASIEISSGEKSKSLNNYIKLCEQVIKTGISRDTIIVAFGGGVIGDLVGFVSSTLLRGLNFIQIPSTLLSQVDSSIGGKTGINSVYGKNLIGTFYQPIAVLTDVSLLQTLNKREILSGYAEIAKHSIIKDKVFFQWLEKNGPDIIMGNNQLRIEAILKSCRIKRSVVEEDEFEKGNRALLNLGHTFGHAIEGYLNYDGTILHGEAVSIGIIMALKLSVKMGYCSKNDYERVLEHFNVVGLPTSMKLYTSKIIDPLKLWKIMQNDKKMYKNHLNFILPDKIGKCTIRKDIEKSDVLSLLNEELRT